MVRRTQFLLSTSIVGTTFPEINLVFQINSFLCMISIKYIFFTVFDISQFSFFFSFFNTHILLDDFDYESRWINFVEPVGRVKIQETSKNISLYYSLNRTIRDYSTQSENWRNVILSLTWQTILHEYSAVTSVSIHQGQFLSLFFGLSYVLVFFNRQRNFIFL